VETNATLCTHQWFPDTPIEIVRSKQRSPGQCDADDLFADKKSAQIHLSYNHKSIVV